MDIPGGDISVYTDFQSLGQLQAQAQHDPAKALGKVAKQFEALFFQMMLKSMREARLSDGMFNSDQMKTYQQMFDRQIALNLADQRSMGIADLLVKQLGGGARAAAAPASGEDTSTAVPTGSPAAAPVVDPSHAGRLRALIGDARARAPAPAPPLKDS